MSEKPDDVHQLLEAIPRDEVHDDSIVHYIDYIEVEEGPRDYGRLADLAAAIKDPVKKRKAASYLLTSLYRNDRGGAGSQASTAAENKDGGKNVTELLLALIKDPEQQTQL